MFEFREVESRPAAAVTESSAQTVSPRAGSPAAVSSPAGLQH